MDNCDDLKKNFDAAWGHCSGRFARLEDFCGGLASTCAKISTVKSDFSVIGWNKNEHRQSLTDFSLISILCAKQFERIS